tara:strand:+ start:75 stop:314 length:240 start_codon:yes stop_codon:yes gene_type:complete
MTLPIGAIIFQKRHHEKIANLLHEMYWAHDWDPVIWTNLVDDFLLMFEGDNPDFKRDRFLHFMDMEWTDDNLIRIKEND